MDRPERPPNWFRPSGKLELLIFRFLDLLPFKLGDKICSFVWGLVKDAD